MLHGVYVPCSLCLPCSSCLHASVDSCLTETRHNTRMPMPACRLFRLREAVSQWLGSHAPSQPCLAWKAHAAPATSLSVIQPAGSTSALLISGGDDGMLRAWSIPTLSTSARAPQGTSGQAAAGTASAPGAIRHTSAASEDADTASGSGSGFKAVWELQLPRAPASWFAAAAGTPGVTCTSLDKGAGLLFVGRYLNRCNRYAVLAAFH